MTTTAHIPSFVDLRALAATSSAPSPLPSGDRFQASRQWLNTPAVGVTIDALHLDGGSGSVEALADDEFVLVLAGGLTINDDQVGIDGSIVVPRGQRFDWAADAGTVALVMGCGLGPAGGGRPVPIDTSAALEPSSPPLADLLVGPTPACRNFTDFRSASGEYMIGTWDSTPYERVTMPYRHCELMLLLEGAVTFVDGVGRSGTFSKGDVFLVEQGAHCSWLSETHVKKVYVIFRPA
ncbi:cupin domain-containing protein [Variovorax sp. RHLX14]|uniref:cupin domain-containing protein n=1 Tax=Variovorax sp. RHLX14 TaxID=1259731 RepID=UPI003F44B074